MSATLVRAVLVGVLASATLTALGGAVRATTDGPSSIAEIRRLITTPPRWVGERARKAALPWSATALWRAVLLSAGAAGACGLVLGGATGTAVAVVTFVAFVGLAVACAPDRRAALRVAALPEALESAAHAMRSGCSVRDGVAAAASGPLTDDLRAVVADIDAGHSPVDAFDRWAERWLLPGVQLAAAAIAVSMRSGSSLARALDGVAATLRDRQRLAAELRALAAQARLSAAVLAAAPLAFAVLLIGIDGGAAAFVARTPVGWACVAGGLTLNGVGAVWMRRTAGAVQ